MQATPFFQGQTVTLTRDGNEIAKGFISRIFNYPTMPEKSGGTLTTATGSVYGFIFSEVAEYVATDSEHRAFMKVGQGR